MRNMVPNKVFFTSGVGKAKEKLRSFEAALRDAGIARFNIVPVSSIFPPKCMFIDKSEGLGKLIPGQLLFSVLAQAATNEPSRLITASIGLAAPANREHYGYISEHHAYGETKEYASDFAEDLAATMLATTLGIEFDPDQAYDERKEIYKMSGKIVETFSVTASAEGDMGGEWTSVVAAAVFVFDDND